jgi:hypothetical protein
MSCWEMLGVKRVYRLISIVFTAQKCAVNRDFIYRIGLNIYITVFAM